MSSALAGTFDLLCWCSVWPGLRAQAGVGAVVSCVCVQLLLWQPQSLPRALAREQQFLSQGQPGDLAVPKDREETKACSTHCDQRHFLVLWLAWCSLE